MIINLINAAYDIAAMLVTGLLLLISLIGMATLIDIRDRINKRTRN